MVRYQIVSGSTGRAVKSSFVFARSLTDGCVFLAGAIAVARGGVLVGGEVVEALFGPRLYGWNLEAMVVVVVWGGGRLLVERFISALGRPTRVR